MTVSGAVALMGAIQARKTHLTKIMIETIRVITTVVKVMKIIQIIMGVMMATKVVILKMNRVTRMKMSVTTTTMTKVLVETMSKKTKMMEIEIITTMIFQEEITVIQTMKGKKMMNLMVKAKKPVSEDRRIVHQKC